MVAAERTLSSLVHLHSALEAEVREPSADARAFLEMAKKSEHVRRGRVSKPRAREERYTVARIHEERKVCRRSFLGTTAFKSNWTRKLSTQVDKEESKLRGEGGNKREGKYRRSEN